MFLSISLLFILVAPLNVNAEEPIKVYLDGERINFSVDPIIKNGTTLVPFRTIFEELGMMVDWNSTTRKVTGQKDGLKIELIIGNKAAYVNGKRVNLLVAPEIIKGNTMVPLRFIGEASGENVKWNGDSKTINIGKEIFVYYHYWQGYDNLSYSIRHEEEGGLFSIYHEITLDYPLKKVDSLFADKDHPTFGYYPCVDENIGVIGGTYDEVWFEKYSNSH